MSTDLCHWSLPLWPPFLSLCDLGDALCACQRTTTRQRTRPRIWCWLNLFSLTWHKKKCASRHTQTRNKKKNSQRSSLWDMWRVSSPVSAIVGEFQVLWRSFVFLLYIISLCWLRALSDWRWIWRFVCRIVFSCFSKPHPLLSGRLNCVYRGLDGISGCKFI